MFVFILLVCVAVCFLLLLAETHLIGLKCSEFIDESHKNTNFSCFVVLLSVKEKRLFCMLGTFMQLYIIIVEKV